MNKKGDENRLMFFVGMAILGFLIGAGILGAINNYLDDTTYWKIYYARDIGLMLDAGITGRGDFELNYDFGEAEKPLVFKLKEQWVEIYDYESPVPNPPKTRFRYATDNNVPVEETELFSQYMTFQLSGDVVRAIEGNPKKEFCPEFNTIAENPGDISINIEFPANKAIKTFISSGLNIKGFNTYNLPPEPDLTIILTVGEGKLTRMYYYDDPQRSDKLACIIRNKIIDEIIDEDEFITLSETQQEDTIYFGKVEMLKDSSEWAKKLSKSGFGLVIEAPNFNEGLAKAITKGVVKYYE
ncbi:hypothetical protein ACFLTH_12605 [Bacteroidota bacterium]